jgi:hypothetical protein
MRWQVVKGRLGPSAQDDCRASAREMGGGFLGVGTQTRPRKLQGYT